MRAHQNVESEVPFAPRAIGTSITSLVMAFQQEGRDLLQKSEGSTSRAIGYVLEDLRSKRLITEDDFEDLLVAYAEALDVVHGNADPYEALRPARRRYAQMIASPHSTEVACVLAELCMTAVAESAPFVAPGGAGEAQVAYATTTTITGKKEQALFWGAVGAVVGGTIGGAPGALIGAAVGAALGACGESDTTITTTP